MTSLYTHIRDPVSNKRQKKPLPDFLKYPRMASVGHFLSPRSQDKICLALWTEEVCTHWKVDMRVLQGLRNALEMGAG